MNETDNVYSSLIRFNIQTAIPILNWRSAHHYVSIPCDFCYQLSLSTNVHYPPPEVDNNGSYQSHPYPLLPLHTPNQSPMSPTPILLLKTKSSPHDGYEDFFSAHNYTPTFIPVLEHRFHKNNLTQVRDLFSTGAFNNVPRKYGGLIFTSQRAVEGFAQMIEEEKDGTYT